LAATYMQGLKEPKTNVQWTDMTTVWDEEMLEPIEPIAVALSRLPSQSKVKTSHLLHEQSTSPNSLGRHGLPPVASPNSRRVFAEPLDHICSPRLPAPAPLNLAPLKSSGTYTEDNPTYDAALMQKKALMELEWEMQNETENWADYLREERMEQQAAEAAERQEEERAIREAQAHLKTWEDWVEYRDATMRAFTYEYLAKERPVLLVRECAAREELLRRWLVLQAQHLQRNLMGEFSRGALNMEMLHLVHDEKCRRADLVEPRDRELEELHASYLAQTKEVQERVALVQGLDHDWSREFAEFRTVQAQGSAPLRLQMDMRHIISAEYLGRQDIEDAEILTRHPFFEAARQNVTWTHHAEDLRRVQMQYFKAEDDDRFVWETQEVEAREELYDRAERHRVRILEVLADAEETVRRYHEEQALQTQLAAEAREYKERWDAQDRLVSLHEPSREKVEIWEENARQEIKAAFEEFLREYAEEEALFALEEELEETTWVEGLERLIIYDEEDAEWGQMFGDSTALVELMKRTPYGVSMGQLLGNLEEEALGVQERSRPQTATSSRPRTASSRGMADLMTDLMAERIMAGESLTDCSHVRIARHLLRLGYLPITSNGD